MENYRERDFVPRQLAGGIYLQKMIAGLLPHPKGQFYPRENNKHLFYFY